MLLTGFGFSSALEVLILPFLSTISDDSDISDDWLAVFLFDFAFDACEASLAPFDDCVA